MFGSQMFDFTHRFEVWKGSPDTSDFVTLSQGLLTEQRKTLGGFSGSPRS